MYWEWARKDQGKPDRSMPRKYSRSTQTDGSGQREGDVEAIVKKGDEPGEAAGEEGKIEDKQTQGAQAEGDAYPAVGVHGDDHPVYEAGVSRRCRRQSP